MLLLNHQKTLLVVASLWLGGCGPDLPQGWNGAESVDALTQSQCQGSPYEGTHDEHIEGSMENSPVTVAYRFAHFRCEQEVEAFYRLVGDGVEVLVQPVDMDPSAVAACDCLYDIDFELRLEADLAPTSLTLLRRWDHQGGDDLVTIGQLARE